MWQKGHSSQDSPVADYSCWERSQNHRVIPIMPGPRPEADKRQKEPRDRGAKDVHGASFGSSLRRLYGQTLNEPLDDDFKDLLDKLK